MINDARPRELLVSKEHLTIFVHAVTSQFPKEKNHARDSRVSA